MDSKTSGDAAGDHEKITALALVPVAEASSSSSDAVVPATGNAGSDGDRESYSDDYDYEEDGYGCTFLEAQGCRDVRIISNDMMDEMDAGSNSPSEASTSSLVPPNPKPSPATGPLPNAKLNRDHLGQSLTVAAQAEGASKAATQPAGVAGPAQASMAYPNAAGRMAFLGPGGVPMNGAPMPGGQIAGGMWAVAPVEPTTMQWTPMVPVPMAKNGIVPTPQPLPPAGVEPGELSPAEEAMEKQMRAHYDWRIQKHDEEMQNLQQQMLKLEEQRTEVRDKWEHERNVLIREMMRYAAVLTRYAIPLEEACEVIDEQQQQQQMDMGAWNEEVWKGDMEAVPTIPETPTTPDNKNLDEMMRKLNGLITVPAGGSHTDPSSTTADEASAPVDTDNSESPSGTMATLQAMFPNAKIRTQEDEEGKAYDDAQQDKENKAAQLQQSKAAAEASAEIKAIAGIRPSPSQSYVAKEELRHSYIGQGCSAVLGDCPVGRLAEELEQTTSSLIDERALRALQSLTEIDALEVLRKVEDLVTAQGGRCRNLSSILQSVCRKVERRASSRADVVTAAPVAVAEIPSPVSPDSASSSRRPGPEGDNSEEKDSGDGESGDGEEPATGRKARKRRARARRKKGLADSDGEAEAAEKEEEAAAVEKEDAETADSQVSRRHRRRGLVDGEGDDGTEDAEALVPRSPTEPPRRQRQSAGKLEEALAFLEVGEGEAPRSYSSKEDTWTTRRVERAASRGFEFKHNGTTWDLKINMASLDPQFTEGGMERYCGWLQRRLQSLRDEHGHQALRKCSGEVDFSSNGLSNQAIWMLLEALSQYEVQVAILKLSKNTISQGGALAIGEFIRTNKRAQAIYEIHLSHNEIDDDNAVELLRSLHLQKPKYPPRKPSEIGSTGLLVPVWVRLNDNRIRDQQAALRALDFEGITYALVKSSNGGPPKAVKSDSQCPLVHLDLIPEQASSSSGHEAAESHTARGEEEAAADDDDDEDADGFTTAAGSRRKRNRKSRQKQLEKEEWREKAPATKPAVQHQ